MKKLLLVLAAVAAVSTLGLTTHQSENDPEWFQWAKGVWLFENSSYMVITDSHYFVITASGDTSNPLIYCAASQLAFTPKGLVHTERLFAAHRPEGENELFRATQTDRELPLSVDTAKFVAEKSEVVNDVWYDAIIELTDDYVLLSTNNGDKAKFFKDGRAVYMPKAGGEFISRKVEQL
ncbi:MAG: hypothetical protein IPH75_08470 [bacterium]|nr:hypothetical protein [bacterium]